MAVPSEEANSLVNEREARQQRRALDQVGDRLHGV
jgi:hypothetical protein